MIERVRRAEDGWRQLISLGTALLDLLSHAQSNLIKKKINIRWYCCGTKVHSYCSLLAKICSILSIVCLVSLQTIELELFTLSASGALETVAGRGPLPGPKTGLLSNTWKWIVRGETCADKARDFIGKGCPGGEQGGKGTKENSSVMWLSISGFYGDGISFQVVFCQPFWLRVLPSGARLVQPRRMPDRRIVGGGRTCGVSFWLFPNFCGWWKLILCFLPEPLVVKQLMQMVTMVPVQGGRFQSVCFP